MYFIIGFIYFLHWYQTFLKFGCLYNFCLLSEASQDKATKQLWVSKVEKIVEIVKAVDVFEFVEIDVTLNISE